MENRKGKGLFSWYYGRASIKTKLVISFFLLITIPILVLGGHSFTISKQNMERQTIDTMENNMKLIVSELEVSLKRENDNIRYLSYNTLFRQTLKNSAGDRVAVARVLNEVVEPIFWYFITSDNNMKGIEIFSPYVKEEIGSFLKPEESCRDEAWFSWHEDNYGTRWTYEDGELFATRTLLDAATSSEKIGILKLDVYPYTILDTVQGMDFLNNGILLTDADGQVIFAKETGYEVLDREVRKLAGSGGRGAVVQGAAVDSAMEQQDYFLLRSSVEASGWNIYYYVAKTEIMGQLGQIIKSTAVVVAACLVIVVALIGLLSAVLSRRILELKKNAEQVAEGNFNLNLKPGYLDEIGVVATSLQTMCDRLNEMIERVYKAELEKKVMELKALQAMINPHFLYNCLSSIKWKAMMGGNDEISEITGLLAKFYRTSLNGGKQITTVGSELENIRAYVELQQMTHGGRFRAEYELDESGFHYPMPNFLLQPLVENAIEHGLNYQDGEEGEGVLIVRFEAAERYLVFQILNNGPAIEAERLNEVLHKPGKGYGIFNIRERIRIYYGDGCGLTGQVTKEGYTCFTVRLYHEIKGVNEF